MPRKYEILTYEYKELSDTAKKVALEELRERAIDWDNSDQITELFQERLELLGYPTDNVGWSLGYCQGDGVAFYGQIETRKVIDRLYASEPERRESILKLWETGLFDMKITRSNSHYHHFNTMRVEMSENAYDTDDGFQLAESVRDDIQSDVKDVSKELEEIGYKEIEYYTEDATLIDDAEANDIEFTASGKIAKLQSATEIKA